MIDFRVTSPDHSPTLEENRDPEGGQVLRLRSNTSQKLLSDFKVYKINENTDGEGRRCKKVNIFLQV